MRDAETVGSNSGYRIQVFLFPAKRIGKCYPPSAGHRLERNFVALPVELFTGNR